MHVCPLHVKLKVTTAFQSVAASAWTEKLPAASHFTDMSMKWQ
jgi:hypothetical protein